MKKILIIGGSNIDYFGKSFERIRPFDSNIGEITVSFGGVARNICENLARLEIPVTFITTIGTDALSQILLKELHNLGVRVVIPEKEGIQTGGYLAIHNQEGDMELALCDQESIKAISKEYLQSIDSMINGYDYLIIDTNLESETIDYLLDQYQDKTIIMDAISTKKAEKLVHKVSKINYLKCNVLEAEAIIGKSVSKKELIKEFIKQGANHIIITDKEKEIYYLENGKSDKIAVAKIASNEIVNATGVGDAMLSGIIYGIVNDKTLHQAIDYGKKLATLTLKSKEANNKVLTKKQLEE
jgi:pseudouridine kinase